MCLKYSVQCFVNSGSVSPHPSIERRWRARSHGTVNTRFGQWTVDSGHCVRCPVSSATCILYGYFCRFACRRSNRSYWRSNCISNCVAIVGQPAPGWTHSTDWAGRLLWFNFWDTLWWVQQLCPLHGPAWSAKLAQCIEFSVHFTEWWTHLKRKREKEREREREWESAVTA